MNFPRWIGTLTDAQVDTAFGNGSGQIGFTILRIDVPPDSSYWSGEVSAAVRAKNHGAIIFASPWSPPASMKTNGSTIHGSLRTDAYDDFADHLSDFADYMSSNGASLYAISVQNEPDWDPNYEGCTWTPSQMQTFLNNNASVIPTNVIAPETVHYKSDWYNTLSSAPELDIYADHLYGGSPTSVSKEHWMTEHLVLETDWPDALATGKEIHDCMVNNYSAYIWWYIRRYYGPIDESGNVTKRGYVMSQYAKFVRPGYIRVNATASPSSGVYVTAYKSAGTLVIVAINQNSSSSSVTFSLSGGSVDSYTKYETTSSNNVSNMGSVGSTDTLAASSISTYVGITDTDPPAAPTGLSATGGDGTVWLDWDDNSEGDLAGYNVYRSTYSGGGYTEIASLVSSSDYTDNSVTNGTTYYYVVTAEDSATNESGYSNEDDATPVDVPPAAPTGLVATAGSSTVWLSWNNNSEGDLDGYNVYRSTTQGGGYSQINGSLVGTSDYTDITVSNGTTYYYVVTAVDMSLHESGYSNEDWATPSGGAPVIYNFEGIAQSNTNYNAYGCDVDVFPFYDDSENRNSMVEATDQQYVDISADNTAEWTIPTPNVGDELFAWIEMKINVPPDDISRIDLTFNGNTGSSGSITHAIYVMIAGADWTANSSWVQVGSDESIPGGTDTTMTRSITSDISTYIDGTGKIVWGVYETTSNEAMHINYLEAAVYGPPDDPPAAPTGLVATGGDEIAWLDWDDNSEGDLDGYNVYRSTTQGSGYSQINGSLLSSSDYTDNSVTNGITYYYVVTAVDTASQESGYSNEDPATPKIPGSDVEIIGDWVEDLTHAEEAGSNRALIFIAHEESSSGTPTLTSVTYGGQAMDKVIEITSDTSGSNYRNYVAAFILDEAGIYAATGDTFDPTWSASTSSVAYASVFLANVDQTDLIGDSDSAQTGSGTNPISTSALATSDGDMVIDAATCGNVGLYTLTGFTEGYDQQFGSSTGGTGAAGYVSATGTNVTPTADYSDSVNRQAIIGFVVQAAAAIDEPPAAPTGLAAMPGDGTVSLDWNDNNEPDLADYNVKRSTTQGSGYSTIATDVATSDYTDNTVTNGTTYYYVVTAVDTSDNESDNSNEDSATPNDSTAPAAPTGLVTTAGNETVSLDWDNNSEPDMAGYNVYRSTTQGSGYGQLNTSLVADSNYIDNNANNGTTYYYVVTAVDANDNESGYSNEDSATPDYQTCQDVHDGNDGLVSDLSGDCYVDLWDLEVLAGYWLDTNCGVSGDCGGADFIPTDGDVDFEDFSDFAVDWMLCNNPGDPNCTKTW